MNINQRDSRTRAMYVKNDRIEPLCVYALKKRKKTGSFVSFCHVSVENVCRERYTDFIQSTYDIHDTIQLQDFELSIRICERCNNIPSACLFRIV